MYFLCYVLKCFSLYNLAAPQTFYCLLLSYKPKILYAITVVQSVPRRSGCVEGTFRSWEPGEHQHSKYKKFLRTRTEGWGTAEESLWAGSWALGSPGASFSAVGAEPWLLVVWAMGRIICGYAGQKCHAVPEGRATPPAGGCRQPHTTNWVTNGATSGDPGNVAGAKHWGTNHPCQQFAAAAPEHSAEQRPSAAWAGLICPECSQAESCGRARGSVPLQIPPRVSPLLGMPS